MAGPVPGTKPDGHSPLPRWTPNAITVLRVALVIVFLWLMADGASLSPGRRWQALGVLVLAALSDVVDGFLARRFDLTSRFGMVLDTLADRFAQLTITAYFVFVDPRLPAPFLGLLLLRDALTFLGAHWALRRGRWELLAHEAHGRLATNLMFILFVLLTLAAPQRLVLVVASAAALVIVVSAARYLHVGYTRMKASPAAAGKSRP